MTYSRCWEMLQKEPREYPFSARHGTANRQALRDNARISYMKSLAFSFERGQMGPA